MILFGVRIILSMKVMVTKIKQTLSIEKYLTKIRPYSKDILNDLKKSDTWKIQLTIAITFMSSKDDDKERVMHSKRDNIEILINDKVDEVSHLQKKLLNIFHQVFQCLQYPSLKAKEISIMYTEIKIA